MEPVYLSLPKGEAELLTIFLRLILLELLEQACVTLLHFLTYPARK
jgi:hypothetical protein